MVTGYVPHPEIGRDLANFELVYFQEVTHFWNFKDAHTEKLCFTQFKYKNRCLAASHFFISLHN